LGVILQRGRVADDRILPKHFSISWSYTLFHSYSVLENEWTTELTGMIMGSRKTMEERQDVLEL